MGSDAAFSLVLIDVLPPGVRTLCVDVGARATFVRAVVPFHEVGLDFRERGEAGELARSDRPPERAREHCGGPQSLEPLSEPDGLGFALRGQREVGHARVLTRDGPGRLTVPCQVHDRKRVAHEWVPFPCSDAPTRPSVTGSPRREYPSPPTGVLKTTGSCARARPSQCPVVRRSIPTVASRHRASATLA